MLLNLSNHPSANWNADQISAAIERWGEIVDYPFPAVGSRWDEGQMLECAVKIADEAARLSPDAVLCQGEMSMTFILVALLQRRGIPVYAATSERDSIEEKLPDGSIRKQAVFRFVMFREYYRLEGRKGK